MFLCEFLGWDSVIHPRLTCLTHVCFCFCFFFNVWLKYDRLSRWNLLNNKKHVFFSHDGSMVLLYMVCHGSHQYTPFMLAYIWVNYDISLTWIKAILGWFPLLTIISSEVAVRSLKFTQIYIYIYQHHGSVMALVWASSGDGSCQNLLLP